MTDTDRPTPRLAADPSRLARMFRAHRDVVWRMLRCRGLSPDAAADTTQEVFLVAAERLADIQPESERAFLIGTALRLAHTAHRRAGRLQLQDEIEVTDVRTSGVADRDSAIELVGMVLSRIDALLVDVFVLYEIEGFSSVEIADLLEIPMGTVASRLRRAREAFREAAHRIELASRREEKRS